MFKHPAVAAVVVALSIGLSGAALARDPEDVFAGQIITAAKSIPTTAKSKSAYVSTLRRLKTGRFYENKTNKEWKVYYAAFFRRPLASLEVTVKIWDVSGGGRHMITSFEQYMDKRGARSLTSHVTLARDDFGVNKNLLMTMESDGSIIASARFAILGEGEHFTGQVNFSAEEASKGTDD